MTYTPGKHLYIEVFCKEIVNVAFLEGVSSASGSYYDDHDHDYDVAIPVLIDAPHL